jgi:hypothetical protein
MRLIAWAVFVAFIFGLSGCFQNSSTKSERASTDQPKPAVKSTGKPESVMKSTDPSGSTMKSPEATDLLRKFADFYRQKQSFQVDYNHQLTMEMSGMTNTMKSQAKISVERPNRIAIRNVGLPLTLSAAVVEVVCDGQQLTINLPLLKQYSEFPAPKLIDELLANPLAKAASPAAVRCYRSLP